MSTLKDRLLALAPTARLSEINSIFYGNPQVRTSIIDGLKGTAFWRDAWDAVLKSNPEMFKLGPYPSALPPGPAQVVAASTTRSLAGSLRAANGQDRTRLECSYFDAYPALRARIIDELWASGAWQTAFLGLLKASPSLFGETVPNGATQSQQITNQIQDFVKEAMRVSGKSYDECFANARTALPHLFAAQKPAHSIQLPNSAEVAQRRHDTDTRHARLSRLIAERQALGESYDDAYRFALLESQAAEMALA